METNLKIDVASLDGFHRRAFEDVIGCELADNQRLITSVTDVLLPVKDQRPAQTIDDWTAVYDGLSERKIEEIDQITKTHAALSRHLP